MDSMEPLDFKPLEQDKQGEIVKRMEAQLAGGDPEAVRAVVLSLDWLESGEEFVEPLLKLAVSDQAGMAKIALEGLARIGSAQSEEPLAKLVLELIRHSRPDHDEVSAEAIRCLGKVGGEQCTHFLEELIAGPASVNDGDREAAVEALVSLADRGVEGVADIVEKLSDKASGELAKSLRAAYRELNVRQWDEQGYITIEAELENESESNSGDG